MSNEDNIIWALGLFLFLLIIIIAIGLWNIQETQKCCECHQKAKGDQVYWQQKFKDLENQKNL